MPPNDGSRGVGHCFVTGSPLDNAAIGDDPGSHAVAGAMRMVRGLHNTDAAAILTARADRPFADIDDVWRRSDSKVSALERLAEADAFRASLGLARREASWAIKALREAPLPLFAAAARHDERPPPEINEVVVRLKAMTAGREVVEDYRQIGLTLRDHPVTFLRADLTRRNIATCEAATAQRDGKFVRLAGLVLVRQKPGSAKGVMFITLEDETGVANLVIWPSLYEKQRRPILTASMMGVEGRVQREGEVVHVVVMRLHDLSGALSALGEREADFPLPHGRGDKFHNGSPVSDPRSQAPRITKPRDIYVPDNHIDSLKLKARDFR